MSSENSIQKPVLIREQSTAAWTMVPTPIDLLLKQAEKEWEEKTKGERDVWVNARWEALKAEQVAARKGELEADLQSLIGTVKPSASKDSPKEESLDLYDPVE